MIRTIDYQIVDDNGTELQLNLKIKPDCPEDLGLCYNDLRKVIDDLFENTELE